MNVVQLIPPLETEEFSFENFWLLFPRKVARKDARKAWDKLTPAQQSQAVIAIAGWRKVFLARDDERIPHAATWINGERFEDELPAEHRQVTSASHLPAQIPAQGQSTPMPDYVKQMIARLKK